MFAHPQVASKFDPPPLALKLLLGASLAVAGAFAAARLSDDPFTVRILDYLHWNVAYAAAATLAWLGVRDADESDRAARRWLARGLSLQVLGQVMGEIETITTWIPVYHVTDAVFLTLGPCMLLGLTSEMRTLSPLQTRTFSLDAAALALALLTLTLDL